MARRTCVGLVVTVLCAAAIASGGRDPPAQPSAVEAVAAVLARDVDEPSDSGLWGDEEGVVTHGDVDSDVDDDDHLVMTSWLGIKDTRALVSRTLIHIPKP